MTVIIKDMQITQGACSGRIMPWLHDLTIKSPFTLLQHPLQYAKQILVIALIIELTTLCQVVRIKQYFTLLFTNLI